MPSRVEALIRNFLKTDGEALCLVLGERLYLKRGDSRTVVGREPLSEESFRAIANELAPGELVDSLVETRLRVSLNLDDRSEPVEIQFDVVGGAPAMTIVRSTPTRAAETAGAANAGGFPEDLLMARAPGPGAAGGLAQGASPSPPEIGTPRSAGGPESAPSSRAEPPAPRPTFTAAATARAAAVAEAPLERPIDRILLRMLGAEASDVHLTSNTTPCFRIHGEITPQTDMKQLSSAEIAELLHPITPPKYLQEFEDRHDADFAYEIEGVSRFRVNIFRDRGGVGAVLRQIPIRIQTAAELNLPPSVIQLGDLSKGLVLVTGPTGAGKSTTLAALIDHINNNRTDHIITVEDPIEFVHASKKCLVNQREIGNHTRSFKDALRAALREDPDIILVGEMRDLETIAIAIEIAETGHLVFGTLHTSTAASTIDRIVDQFPEDRQSQIRVMLAESLRGIVAQTLLRKKGGGRVAALEILLSNGAVANLIRDAKTFQLLSVMQTSKAQGMLLLNDSLVDLVKRGVVEPREAYLKAVDKLALLAAYRTMNVPAFAEFKTEGTAAPSSSSSPAVHAAGR